MARRTCLILALLLLGCEKDFRNIEVYIYNKESQSWCRKLKDKDTCLSTPKELKDLSAFKQEHIDIIARRLQDCHQKLGKLSLK